METVWQQRIYIGKHTLRQRHFLQEEDLYTDYDPQNKYQDLYEIPFSAVRDYLKYIHEQELDS